MEAEEQVLELPLIINNFHLDRLDDDGEESRALEAMVLVFDLALYEREQFLVVVDAFAYIRILPLALTILHTQHAVL